MCNSAIKQQSESAIRELIELSDIKADEIIVVGCSSSEIIGKTIGKDSSPAAAEAVVSGILPVIKEHGLYLAAQCCEHLNRALIVERELAERLSLEIVCVMPQPKAGGSFATAVYSSMKEPVAVEFIKATAGLDIGGTMIGMHIRHVAVPLRLKNNKIGEAGVQAAKSRPKLIGGARAVYP